jgi:hypothetical protein
MFNTRVGVLVVNQLNDHISMQVLALKGKIAQEKGDDYAAENQKLIYSGRMTLPFTKNPFILDLLNFLTL